MDSEVVFSGYRSLEVPSDGTPPNDSNPKSDNDEEIASSSANNSTNNNAATMATTTTTTSSNTNNNNTTEVVEENLERRQDRPNDSIEESPALSETSLQPSQAASKAVVSILVDEEASSDEETKKQKKKESGYSRSLGLSYLYALVVVLCGLVFPVTEALKETWFKFHVIGAFYLYLHAVGIAFLLFLMIFITHHKKKEKKQHQTPAHEAPPQVLSPVAGDVMLQVRRPRDPSSSTDLSRNGSSFDNLGFVAENGGLKQRVGSKVTFSISSNLDSEDIDTESVFRSKSLADTSSINTSTADDTDDVMEYITLQNQTSTMAHEGTSFYLRFGCLIFSVANILYIALSIEHNFNYNTLPECEYRIVYIQFTHLVFLLVQTYFLLKHNTISVKRYKRIVRFGLMHLVAGNLCVWMRVLVNEVTEGIHESHIEEHADEVVDPNATICSNANSLMRQTAPYLFPFVLEYSLIASAMILSMHGAMDVVVTKDIVDRVKRMLRRKKRDQQEPAVIEHSAHHAGVQFQKSHKGLFCGMVVLGGIFVSITLFFYWNENGDEHLASLVFQICDLTLHTLLLVAVFVGFLKMYHLGFSVARDNSVDNNLLFISLAGLVLLELFIIVSSCAMIWEKPEYLYKDITVLSAIAGIVVTTQAVFQTMFIVDGMQKYAINRKQETKMPGRAIITFLIITNVGVWIFRTFQEKKRAAASQKEFYGATPWAIILNINLPFLLFFRFHSSICLADIWVSAYEPDEKLAFDKMILN